MIYQNVHCLLLVQPCPETEVTIVLRFHTRFSVTGWKQIWLSGGMLCQVILFEKKKVTINMFGQLNFNMGST